MKMNVEMKRGKGKPKNRCLDTIKNDIRAIGVCVEDVENRDEWRFKTGGRHQIIRSKRSILY
jgi:hypothetical protein